MNKAKQLINCINELADKTLDDFSSRSGKSKAEVKKIANDLEKSISKNIDKDRDPNKFFGVLTNQLKKKLGLL